MFNTQTHTHLVVRGSNLIFQTHFWTESLRDSLNFMLNMHSKVAICHLCFPASTTAVFNHEFMHNAEIDICKILQLSII